jgi:hypothetical protein
MSSRIGSLKSGSGRQGMRIPTFARRWTVAMGRTKEEAKRVEIE